MAFGATGGDKLKKKGFIERKLIEMQNKNRKSSKNMTKDEFDK